MLPICFGPSLLCVLSLLCYFNKKGATSSSLSVYSNRGFLLSGRIVQEYDKLRVLLPEME